MTSFSSGLTARKAKIPKTSSNGKSIFSQEEQNDEYRKHNTNFHTEKQTEYYEQRDKFIEQQTAARKRGKKIDSQLVKANSKIQEYENKELFKICKDMNITTKDIITFLKKIPKGTTLDEIVNRAFHRNPEQLHL